MNRAYREEERILQGLAASGWQQIAFVVASDETGGHHFQHIDGRKFRWHAGNTAQARVLSGLYLDNGGEILERNRSRDGKREYVLCRWRDQFVVWQIMPTAPRSYEALNPRVWLGAPHSFSSLRDASRYYVDCLCADRGERWCIKCDGRGWQWCYLCKGHCEGNDCIGCRGAHEENCAACNGSRTTPEEQTTCVQ